MARNVQARGKKPRKPAMSLKEKRLAKKEKQQQQKMDRTAMACRCSSWNNGLVAMWA